MRIFPIESRGPGVLSEQHGIERKHTDEQGKDDGFQLDPGELRWLLPLEFYAMLRTQLATQTPMPTPRTSFRTRELALGRNWELLNTPGLLSEVEEVEGRL